MIKNQCSFEDMKILDIHSVYMLPMLLIVILNLETDKMDKNHLLKFQFRIKAYVTIQGRSPLCLKCLFLNLFIRFISEK